MTGEQGGPDMSRRAVLASAVGIAAAGASGYYAGSADAQTPAGTVGTNSNPYSVAYIDRIHLTDTSLSSPADGTFWYDSSA